MIGETVSIYRIEAELASDSLGVVYKARDTENECNVALRVLPPEATRYPELRERLDRNLTEARSLDHANIGCRLPTGFLVQVDPILREVIDALQRTAHADWPGDRRALDLEY